MKRKALLRTAPARVAAIGLLALASAYPARAATPALMGQLIARPLTPGDIGLYKLPALEVSGGLSTVGVGTPVYLEVELNIAIPPADITGVAWTLTSQPVGSVAALQPSPLGTNVPVYEPGDRPVFQVAGRMLLRPDVTGQYTVGATVTTATEGTTNLTFQVTAGKYVGVNTCALCHSGGLIAKDMVQSWQTTAHSKIFSQGIDGLLGHYSQSCLQCHTVGYDTNTNAVNDGFDDIATQTGWVFPTVLTNGNFAAMPPALQNLANIQCENCHGPGSEHAAALGNTNVVNWPRLSKTVSSGDCNQCHDAPTHHVKGTEWYISGHANGSRIPTGAGRNACVACHTSNGFLARVDPSVTTTNVAYAALGCQTCHEPHGMTSPTNNPHLLRALSNVTMPDGTVVTNAGEGALCLQCHHTRNGAAATNVANYQQGNPTWMGGSSFGVHDSPQGDMIEGINAITYGQTLPSSAHRFTVTNLCVGCHMQASATDPTDPSFVKAGGHTFHMSYTQVSTNGVTNVVDKVDACVQCHGPIKGFDMPVEDYNGDGVIEGVQTEVQHLLDQLSTMLPNSTYVASGNYVADGLVKSSISAKTNWQTKFLNAAYNWQFVNNDGSKGVHNAPFATALLKASMADLSGDANNDGLPDAWQIQYFGSATNPNAAPNANPSGDGVPNWLKYNLGLDPTVPGTSVPGGVVWANGKNLVNPVLPAGATNTIAIYTAAEVAFNTEVGKSYQIQSISSLSDTWSNVGAPVQGTGNPISYVTPTRGGAQNFFRVITLP
jgi:hypothetical protein